MAAKKKTYQDGANEVRSSVLAELRSDLESIPSQIVKKYIRRKISWMLGHNERTNSRPGGLGKR